MLEQVGTDRWCVAKPLSVMGLALGARMTVMRQADGSLALHSPVRLDPDEQAAVDALGPVGSIIVPNEFHTGFFRAAAARWPDAKLHGPALVRRKAPELRWEDAATPDDGTLVGHRFGGAPRANESVFFHAPSRTLVFTDLLFFYPESPRGLTGAYLRWQKVVGRVGQTMLSRSLVRDRAAARASVDHLSALGATRIAVAHGGEWEGDVRAALDEAFAWMGR